MKFNYIFIYFSIKINLLIQVSNTIDKNTKSKVLKTLKNDTSCKLITKVYKILYAFIINIIIPMSDSIVIPTFSNVDHSWFFFLLGFVGQ